MSIPVTAAIRADQVCAVVLAGGEGRRMGGVDKGLQLLDGSPLARHALQRLQQQTLGAPRTLAINANRNQALYASWGVLVWTDAVGGFAGPLAGFHTALAQAKPRSPWPVPRTERKTRRCADSRFFVCLKPASCPIWRSTCRKVGARSMRGRKRRARWRWHSSSRMTMHARFLMPTPWRNCTRCTNRQR